MLDLWWVRTAEVADDALLRACTAVMSADERAKQASFVFEKNRHEYLVTRALCRGVLARYVGARPQDLAFRRNEHGCPALEPPADLQFNLTNTIHFVGCAVVRTGAIGLDAEPLARGDEILDIAETVFTSSERRELARLPLDARRERAVRLWTWKESYMKARRAGLTIPPEAIDITVDAERPVLGFARDLDDDPTRWRLDTYAIADHVVATCVERSASAEAPVVRQADLASLLGL